MLTVNEIRNVSFSRGRGYKVEDVNDFLEQIIATIENLQRENAELVRKLEVLADRIQEYRSEEDSIRSALLTAQKSADKILKDANEEKDTILSDARQQADDSIRLAQEKAVTIANETREKVSLVLNEAKEKATSQLNEAKEKSANMLNQAVEGCKAEKEYLEFLKEQEASFRQQLVEMYKKQFELLKKGPELLKELDRNLVQVPEPVSIEVSAPSEPELQNTSEFIAEEIAPILEPEDVPLPVASIPEEPEEEDVVIDHGFEIKRKFTDLKFGEDYDISSDDDYE